MLYKYELACKEAGLTEEKTKKIRQMFDTEYKRLKRRKPDPGETAADSQKGGGIQQYRCK